MKASEKTVETYSYTPYGSVTISDQNGVVLDSSNYGNEFFFQGRTFDKESGLYYFRNRYYSPDLGRFISRDPLGYDAGDINLYRFVGNNPYGGLDPMGLKLVKGNSLLLNANAEFDQAIAYLKSNAATAEIAKAAMRPEVITIEHTTGASYYSNAIVFWNPYLAVVDIYGASISPALVLLHEIAHANSDLDNPQKHAKDSQYQGTTPGIYPFTSKEEKDVIIGPEREAAILTGEGIRRSHIGYGKNVSNCRYN